MAGQRVEIPYAPRVWARRLHATFKRWAALVLHRRAGKTTAILNHHQRAALDDGWERRRLETLLPGATKAEIDGLMAKRRVYWHVMPTMKQCRLVAWDMLKDISRVVPGNKPNETEMSVRYPNGHKIQLLGADDPDSLRGPGLAGLSLDEYSQIAPNAFGEVLSKALADRLGYCIFAGTIKGKDQLYKIHQTAKDEPTWFAIWQDVDASLATEAGPTLTAIRQAMEDDRKLVRDGVMTQAEFDQEWYLSPEAAIRGAIYGNELAAARKEGRITRVPHEPMLPVDTDWDIGWKDNTSVWFTQSLRSGEVRVIDYYEASGEAIPHYAQMLKERAERKRYVYGHHYGPHDMAVHEMGTGKSRLETFAAHGVRMETTPRISGSEAGEREEGINAVRLLLPRCWFDETSCARGLEALLHYRRGWNTSLNELKAEPVHDWSSHAADAFRGLAVRHRVPKDSKPKPANVARQWGWA